MLELFLAFVVLVLIMAGMAVGIIMGKSPLKGSCGGVGAALNESNYTCDLCEDDQKKCDDLSQYREKKTTQGSGLADTYQATTKRQ
tara:strand:- start:352 stop:609 length:258 start_codon:yes stop_codon:yes gene_type:complete